MCLVHSDRLEKVQLEAARIVTGLPSFASIHSIYIETGWEKLKTRREVTIVVWSKLNVKLHSTPLALKIIISVLVGLNFNNHLFDHFFR
jgi:hypothetical protein